MNERVNEQMNAVQEHYRQELLAGRSKEASQSPKHLQFNGIRKTRLKGEVKAACIQEEQVRAVGLGDCRDESEQNNYTNGNDGSLNVPSTGNLCPKRKLDSTQTTSKASIYPKSDKDFVFLFERRLKNNFRVYLRRPSDDGMRRHRY
uniref:Uncharacterized protein n=1 Tax=Glossina austeni TaxID=7395 RepID=A0A1A9VXW0_GLOAU